MDPYLKIRTELLSKLYTKLSTESDTRAISLEIFNFQAEFNPVYKKYISLLNIDASKVKDIEDIPFLPVQLYKTNTVKSGNWDPETIFESSSTTGMLSSQHHVKDLSVYNKNAEFCFENNFGKLENFKWYALLPSYLERGNSSLVQMVNYFMDSHPGASGGFFLNDHEGLVKAMENDDSGLQRILIGVSFALMDLAINYSPNLNGIIVMETGGMKGRGKELPREELYDLLMQKMDLDKIYSEYGMTELFSQSYSNGKGLFRMPDTMKVLISDLNDPFHFLENGKQGRVNIIDLANIDSCSFLATDDLGVIKDKKHFRILGRTDASDIRGCNLLYTK